MSKCEPRSVEPHHTKSISRRVHLTQSVGSTEQYCCCWCSGGGGGVWWWRDLIKSLAQALPWLRPPEIFLIYQVCHRTTFAAKDTLRLSTQLFPSWCIAWYSCRHQSLPKLCLDAGVHHQKWYMGIDSMCLASSVTAERKGRKECMKCMKEIKWHCPLRMLRSLHL